MKTRTTQNKGATQKDLHKLGSVLQKDIHTLKKEMHTLRIDTKEDINTLRIETKNDIENLRVETKKGINNLRADTKKDLHKLESTLRGDMKGMQISMRKEWKKTLKETLKEYPKKIEMQEEFKNFGEGMMKIFATKEDLKQFVTRDEWNQKWTQLFATNDIIIEKLTKMEQEQVFGFHRMDRFEVRLQKLENKPHSS